MAFVWSATTVTAVPLFLASSSRHNCNRHSNSVLLEKQKLELACAAAREGPNIDDEDIDRALAGEDSEALLKELADAAARVGAAKQELEAQERLELKASDFEAHINTIQSADSLVAECQRDVLAAEAELNAARLDLVKSYAGQSLLDTTGKWKTEDIDENRERLESVKAATTAGLVGAVANFPFALSLLKGSGSEILLSEALILISCALFGLTYRYVVRRDIGNVQLKAGSAAAFAIVRGLGQLDAKKVFAGFPDSASQEIYNVTVFTIENLIIFGFAVLILDYCFQKSFLTPFPANKPDSSK